MLIGPPYRQVLNGDNPHLHGFRRHRTRATRTAHVVTFSVTRVALYLAFLPPQSLHDGLVRLLDGVGRVAAS